MNKTRRYGLCWRSWGALMLRKPLDSAPERAWAEIGRRYDFVSVTEQLSTEKTPSRNKK
jgi:hypothetical protein